MIRRSASSVIIFPPVTRRGSARSVTNSAICASGHRMCRHANPIRATEWRGGLTPQPRTCSTEELDVVAVGVGDHADVPDDGIAVHGTEEQAAVGLGHGGEPVDVVVTLAGQPEVADRAQEPVLLLDVAGDLASAATRRSRRSRSGPPGCRARRRRWWCRRGWPAMPCAAPSRRRRARGSRRASCTGGRTPACGRGPAPARRCGSAATPAGR